MGPVPYRDGTLGQRRHARDRAPPRATARSGGLPFHVPLPAGPLGNR
jgi:hypothetical protein